MILNYIRIALRNIRKNLLFTLLNTIGLALGIMVSIFIVSWIIDEISFDKYNKKHDRIFRVERHIDWRDFNLEMPITSGPYKQALIDNFPEVVNATRINPQEAMFKDRQNVYRKNKAFFVDGSILEMFTFPIIEGNQAALMEPNSIVLTKGIAEKLLGYSEEVVGKSIKMEYEGTEYNLKISALIHKIPVNSHFHPEILVSLPTLYPTQKENLENWVQNILYTYIELANSNDDRKLINQFPDFLETQVGPSYKSILDDGETINDMITLKLKKLSRIHLHSQLEFELEANGNITIVYLFAAVAILILVIASINFINLSTVKGETRALEVGIRKVSGAHRKQLVIQFLVESMIVTGISFLIALLFAELSSGFYSNITGKEFNWFFFFNIKYFLTLLLIVLFTGLLAGIYPALFLTNFSALSVLKAGNSSNPKRGRFRMVLVIFQFFISISFIILSILIYYQLDFIQNKSIGYDKSNLIILPVNSSAVQQSYESFKDELLSNPALFKNVSSAAEITTSHMYEAASMRKQGENEGHFMIFMNINYDFIKTLKLELIEGRSFKEEFSDTSHNRYILNETAAHNFGWLNPSEAIGEIIEPASNSSAQGEVIGIVKDFHFKSMHQEIEPLIFKLAPSKLSYIYVRINPSESRNAINFLSNTWEKKFPEAEFNYFFLVDELDNQYTGEKKLKDKLVISTFLAIIIACLGLIGLSLFILKQKTKEIGVRKVLGASVQSIVSQLSLVYLKWVGISTLIAWPVSYWIINKWLLRFSSQIELVKYWWVFILSGILATFLTLVVVSVQTIKYATINPSESLKYE